MVNRNASSLPRGYANMATEAFGRDSEAAFALHLANVDLRPALQIAPERRVRDWD